MAEGKGLWQRLRRLGTRVEDNLFELTEEEERQEEPPGRSSLVVLLNAFLSLWKATEANVVERVLGLAGLGSALWLLIGEWGLGVRRTPLALLARTLASVWLVPGFIASLAAARNLGWENLRRPRLWPILLIFVLGGLISFRAVFGELTRPRLGVARRRPGAVG